MASSFFGTLAPGLGSLIPVFLGGLAVIGALIARGVMGRPVPVKVPSRDPRRRRPEARS